MPCWQPLLALVGCGRVAAFGASNVDYVSGNLQLGTFVMIGIRPCQVYDVEQFQPCPTEEGEEEWMWTKDDFERQLSESAEVLPKHDEDARASAAAKRSVGARTARLGSAVWAVDRVISPSNASALINVLEAKCAWISNPTSNRSSCELPLSDSPAARQAITDFARFWGIHVRSDFIPATRYPSGFRGWPDLHTDEHEISGVVYLNDSPAGTGELLFPNAGLSIAPEAGKLVTWMTPSDNVGRGTLLHTVGRMAEDGPPRYALQLQGVKTERGDGEPPSGSFASPILRQYDLVPEGKLVKK
uniref:Fe2OG dioxygenase domain-containing protein n=1 Tax=Calcidiscus leptoporus TaxID=127549 RepID=A0A7S0NU08_9EUKA|mmetsp:Transcript_24721/g.57582  ORF Transcript_24721/g.57582 Transcript_24721/m.57582 type:complete len:301 (+) Transcript_24721:114-1016(+)